MASASTTTLLMKGVFAAASAPRSSTAIPQLTFGAQLSGGTSYNGMYRLFGVAVYHATLSQADATTASASLDAAFVKPASYDYVLALTGDSIIERSGGLLLQNTPYG